jgi:hypothetical protein
MRRILTLTLLAVLAVAMMGAEDPKCDKANGRTPQPAEHDPAPRNDPRQQHYLFRLQFATYPTRTVHFSYRFGADGESNLRTGEPGWSTQRQVTPGTVLWLKVTSDAGALATYTCAISWVEDAKRIRVRAHFIRRGATGCELRYTVREGEEDYPSL